MSLKRDPEVGRRAAEKISKDLLSCPKAKKKIFKKFDQAGKKIDAQIHRWNNISDKKLNDSMTI